MDGGRSRRRPRRGPEPPVGVRALAHPRHRARQARGHRRSRAPPPRDPHPSRRSAGRRNDRRARDPGHDADAHASGPRGSHKLSPTGTGRPRDGVPPPHKPSVTRCPARETRGTPGDNRAEGDRQLPESRQEHPQIGPRDRVPGLRGQAGTRTAAGQREDRPVHRRRPLPRCTSGDRARQPVAHETTRAFEEDRRRDRYLLAKGYRVMRITHRQLHEEHATIAAQLRSLTTP